MDRLMMMDRWMIIWIVDLLGPPDPPMMEAMGVEDAVSKWNIQGDFFYWYPP